MGRYTHFLICESQPHQIREVKACVTAIGAMIEMTIAWACNDDRAFGLTIHIAL